MGVRGSSSWSWSGALKYPPVSASKEVQSHLLLRDSTSRWLWRLYAERLTRGGRWFLWPTLLFTGYGSISMAFQGFVPFSYAVGAWVVALLAIPLFRPRVRLRADDPPRVCAGEIAPVNIEVEPTGRWPGFDLMVLPHRLPAPIDSVPDEGLPLAPFDGRPQRVTLNLRCTRRGVYELKGYRVDSDFPLGLLRSTRRFSLPQRLVVYPRFTRLGRLELPTARRYQPGGVAMASTLGESFEFIGDRDYREGDNVRDIDWRATARLNRPIVREYRDEYYLRVAVILDTRVPEGAPPTAEDDFERAVSLAAAISDYMAREDYLVDLFAAGPNLYHLLAGRSLAYLEQILDILACVNSTRDEPFAVLEPELAESLARISTVICVMLDWDQSRRDFVQRLRAQGSGVKVIVARSGGGACTIDPAADADWLGPVPIVDAPWLERGVEQL